MTEEKKTPEIQKQALEGAGDQNRQLTEEEIEIMAKQMGVSRDHLAGRIIKMSPEFIEQMKAGKLKFQKKAVEDTEKAPNGFRPPTPRGSIERRYAGVLNKAAAMRRTSKLPAATTGRALHAPQDLGKNEDKPIQSAFMEHSKRLKKMVLSERPPGAPSILEECRFPVKLFVSQHQSPGDILMLSRAVDDLHKSYPGKFITCMRTPATDIWENNPNHTQLKPDDPDAMWVACGYKLINTANKGSHHFSHGFRKDLEAKLGLPIDQTKPCGAIYISDHEKAWYSQVWEILGKNVPFWILDAGRKSDYTCKHWEVTRFQELIERTPEITWVQIGATKDKKNPHYHPELTGDNLINLVGKTSIRQLIRLVYHSAGVVTPVSFPMHLAAAVEMHPRYRRQTRPCVVIAGGREPAMWEAYSTHQFLHTCGALPCCSHGGCWKSRVIPLGDGDDKDYDDEHKTKTGQTTKYTRLCERPVVTGSGQIIPQCMDMITVDMVVQAVRWYMQSYDYSAEEDADWSPKPYSKPEKVKEIITEINEKTAAGKITRKNKVTDSAAQPKNTEAPELPEPSGNEHAHAPKAEEGNEETQEKDGSD